MTTERTLLKVGWITVVCLILLRNLEQDRKCNHYDIADEIEERLYRLGYRLHDFGLRKAPGGFSSEDALAWLWQIYSLGTYEGDPHGEGLILNDNGWRFCREIVQAEDKENHTELCKVATMLAASDVLTRALVTQGSLFGVPSGPLSTV